MMVSNPISCLWVYCSIHYKCIFNEKETLKKISFYSRNSTLFKALLWWQVLVHLRKSGEGGAGLKLSAVLTFFSPWKERRVPMWGRLASAQSQGHELWGCLPLQVLEATFQHQCWRHLLICHLFKSPDWLLASETMACPSNVALNVPFYFPQIKLFFNVSS